jgi:hypothetical protein
MFAGLRILMTTPARPSGCRDDGTIPLVSFGRDYWGGRIFNDQWEELRREPLLLELKQRLRDVRQGRDGFLYVLTAEQDGALLRIEPR